MLNVIEERDITEVLLGMHRRATIIDSFYGAKVEQLLRATNKMIIITRCYIPVNTLTRIVVWVPDDAQYETGFSRWVRGIARLTRQLGCRVIFHAPAAVQPLIRGVLYSENLGVRCEFATAESQDDFVLLANKVLEDDLFVMVGARPNSVSYSSDMVEMQIMLQRYFGRNNLCLIYPEQFGTEQPQFSFTDPLGSDIVTTASPLWLAVRSRLHRLNMLKKRITHRNRR